LSEALNLHSLGKYELVVSLGRGGMANVYLALVAGPGRFNKLMVLKILRDDISASADESVNMFLDEARLSARLEHPNIVHTYEVGEYEGRYFLAMEYLDGQSFRTLQQRARAVGGAIPIHEELRIIAETARGLHYAHQLKGYNGEPLHVVHRDVSPQNVFVTYDGQVKLLDFGIAKTSDAEHMTQVGIIKGKLEYIAPEQIQGGALDCRADVFALGAMLWEAITGQRFAGGPKVSEVTKVHTRMTGGEPNVRTVQPETPEPLARIVDRAIALRPELRWPDAGAFADAIDAYLESTGHKPTGKSLAAFVAPLFEEQRRQTSRLIEQQIEKVKQRGVPQFGENTGSLPRLKLGDDSTSGLYVQGQGEEAQSAAEVASRSLAPLNQESPASKRKQYRVWGLVVGAAILVGAGGSLLGTPPDAAPAATPASSVVATPVQTAVPSETKPAQPAAKAAVESAAETEVAVAQVVSLTVQVSPSGAKVTLDGAPITTPFTGKFRKDASLHHLEAVAEGYQAQKQLVAFDQDRVLELQLERTRERAAGAAGNRRVRRTEKEATPEVVSETPRSEPPAAAATDDAMQPGQDLKAVKPRILRGQLDAIDPYSGAK
jgi:eukaryotic-like serine/threonine-protein kinase